MKIEIKKSTKPVKYQDAINFLENRLIEINGGKNNELSSIGIKKIPPYGGIFNTI